MSERQIRSLREHQIAALAEGKAGSSFFESDEETPTAMKLSSLRSEYVGPIGVGTTFPSEACALAAVAKGSQSQDCNGEAQSHVWVVFDTGSTNLWVNSDACIDGSCAKPERARYNHSESRSYQSPEPPVHLEVYFGSGKITGPLAIDDFHIGPLTLQGQTFGMIEEQVGAVFERYPIEGIVGLGFQSLAAKGTTPFFENVIKQSALPSNEVSFYFSLANPSANAMLWGGVDSKFHTEPIEFFNVTRPHYWGLDLMSFQIGSVDVLSVDGVVPAESEEKDAPWEAIIDSGTTYFTAPDKLFREIMSHLQSDVPCRQMTEKTHPPITIRLVNAAGTPRELVLNNNQYMASTGGKDDSCHASFMKLTMGTQHAKSMIFGEVLMRNYYSVFDRADGEPSNARVGFALAAQGEPVESHLRTITQDQPLFQELHPKFDEDEEE